MTKLGGICGAEVCLVHWLITFRQSYVLDVDSCLVLRLKRVAAKSDTVQNHKQEELNMWTNNRKNTHQKLL